MSHMDEEQVVFEQLILSDFKNFKRLQDVEFRSINPF